MATSATGGVGIPCAFTLLPSKEQIAYDLMLKVVKKRVGTNICLQTIITDYESAMFNSLLEYFPDQDHLGCSFHFRKAVWKNMCERGLQSFFYQNADFNELLYKLYALAYIPTEHVIRVWEEQIHPFVEQMYANDEDWMENKPALADFGSYFTRTWIGVKSGRAGNRRRPMFPLESWNMYEATLEDGPTTNNTLESWNRTWNSLNGKHPNLWKVLSNFVKQEAEARRMLLMEAADYDTHNNTGRKRNSEAYKARVKSIVSKFGVLPDAGYLQQIAHELSKGD